MPVFPDVASTIVVRPGSMIPSASAASIIATPIRSLTLPAGLYASSLPISSAPQSGARRVRRTIGVPPTRSARFDGMLVAVRGFATDQRVSAARRLRGVREHEPAGAEPARRELPGVGACAGTVDVAQPVVERARLLVAIQPEVVRPVGQSLQRAGAADALVDHPHRLATVGEEIDDRAVAVIGKRADLAGRLDRGTPDPVAQGEADALVGARIGEVARDDGRAPRHALAD